MRLWKFSLLIVFIVFGLGSSCSQGIGPSGERLLGNRAPDFVLKNLAGESVALANVVSQKPTLLVFWASWCPTCVEEIPTLNEWTAQYPHLQILGIDVQEPGDRVRHFVEKKKIRYPVLLDPEGDVAEQYGLVGIPASVLLAKGGQIIYYGFALPKNIEQLIKE